MDNAGRGTPQILARRLSSLTGTVIKCYTLIGVDENDPYESIVSLYVAGLSDVTGDEVQPFCRRSECH